MIFPKRESNPAVLEKLVERIKMTEQHSAGSSKPLVALAMSARSMLRQAKCPECHYNGTQGGAGKCHWCLERAALMDALLSQPTPDETNVGAYDPTLGPPPRPKVPSAERWPKTPADLFDQYPVGTIFQKKSDGRVLALTPDDGVTHEARAPLKALPPQCSCDPNPSIGGSPPCPVHDGENEDAV